MPHVLRPEARTTGTEAPQPLEVAEGPPCAAGGAPSLDAPHGDPHEPIVFIEPTIESMSAAMMRARDRIYAESFAGYLRMLPRL